LAAIVVGGSLVAVPPAGAQNRFMDMPAEKEAKRSPAYIYANMTNAEALRELKARRIPFKPARPPLPGVRAPIRLTAKLRGVWLHSALPAERRKDSIFEILDARLALALDDFCKILAAHDVVEVVHFTMYRPPRGEPTDADGNRFRHPGGLAFDFGAAKKRNGEWLAIGPHWAESIGAKTCGKRARRIENRKGRELRSIVCEAFDQRLFHYSLTPHYDAPHADHLHLELKPETKYFVAH
jgi:hypothetical protein